MKLLCALLALLSFESFAITKVVYGDDNRLDYYQVQNPEYQNWARSTAAMIRRHKIEKISDDMYQLKGETLEESGVCSSERYAEQMTSASCTAFLVAPDLMVTAGHCAEYFFDCVTNFWVFDYAITYKGQNDYHMIPAENVIKCDDIVESISTEENDYSLFRLKRRITDRDPLQFRKSGKVSRKTPLVIIGHPTGLPVKIADGATVEKNTHKDFFVTNTDSFHGNSGSPVINTETGEVEGILVRGEKDYEYGFYNPDGSSCKKPLVCKQSLGWGSDCRGEDVTRITNIQALIN